jgi:hypothetical protein
MRKNKLDFFKGMLPRELDTICSTHGTGLQRKRQGLMTIVRGF